MEISSSKQVLQIIEEP